jgi:sterol desaturase/sphingolipid hydroxylase (fatty acid hydroxylase superfamily)
VRDFPRSGRTNYSTIFSLWDRLLGTRSALETRSIRFGIDVIPESAEREKSAARVMRLAMLPASEGVRPRAAGGAAKLRA